MTPTAEYDADIERRTTDRLLLAAHTISLTLAIGMMIVAIFPSLRGDDPAGMIMLGVAMLLARPLAAGR